MSITKLQGIDNALDLYELSDHLIIDQLKINCLKFISLNIVSFLELGQLDKLSSLPVYLIRDLENFIKLEDQEKFIMNDMRAIEEAVHEQSERQTRNFKTKKDVLNHERCLQIYQEIEEMLAEYELNCRL